MSMKTLIKEAANKNALGFEAALKEELRSRMALAIEAKMNGEEESDDASSEEDDEDDKEAMRNESAQLDEISSKLASGYSVKASDASRNKKLPVKKVGNRIAGVHRADEKVRKMEGKSSTAKVPTTSMKKG